MPVIPNSLETQEYAIEIQNAMFDIMGRHAESVGFTTQISIIGVAIGAMLDQLPARDKNHFIKILMRNVKEARKYSAPMRMQ